MIAVGDKVKVAVGENVVVIGIVSAVDEFRIVFTEVSAHSVWGDSNAGAGTVHSVDPATVELYTKDEEEEDESRA